MAAGTRIERARDVVALVPDPEIPVLTIDDLGILRGVDEHDGRIVVTITPTYSGCPAMDHIREQVGDVLADAGFADAEVRMVYSPAWTTDWMSEEGKRKLREFGISPPGRAGEPTPLTLPVACPQCGSRRTSVISQFGSTACKALYRCDACQEPFDHFKAI
jgi:ring-1,2-phenylacetyl-CoA epoxidase subunit PaaD